MYPDCRVLFGSGDPVIISGADGREARQILWCHDLGCARHRSSRLLKEFSQFIGRGDEIDHRLVRDVAPGVPRPPWHVDIISRFCHDPFVAPRVLLENLYLDSLSLS